MLFIFENAAHHNLIKEEISPSINTRLIVLLVISTWRLTSDIAMLSRASHMPGTP
jgi:hypothetical protein